MDKEKVVDQLRKLVGTNHIVEITERLMGGGKEITIGKVTDVWESMAWVLMNPLPTEVARKYEHPDGRDMFGNKVHVVKTAGNHVDLNLVIEVRVLN